MNLMPEILKKLGVEVGERFDIKGDGRIGFVNIYFDETYCLWDKDQKNINEIILLLIVGEYEIIKKPWIPNHFSQKYACDTALVALGNCFQTKENAEDAEQEMLAKMKKVWVD